MDRLSKQSAMPEDGKCHLLDASVNSVHSSIYSQSINCGKAKKPKTKRDPEKAGTFPVSVSEKVIGLFLPLILGGWRKSKVPRANTSWHTAAFLRLYCPFSFDDIKHFFQPLFSMSVTSTKKTKDLSKGRQMTEKTCSKKKGKKKEKLSDQVISLICHAFSKVSTPDTTLPVSPAHRQALTRRDYHVYTHNQSTMP